MFQFNIFNIFGPSSWKTFKQAIVESFQIIRRWVVSIEMRYIQAFHHMLSVVNEKRNEILRFSCMQYSTVYGSKVKSVHIFAWNFLSESHMYKKIVRIFSTFFNCRFQKDKVFTQSMQIYDRSKPFQTIVFGFV